MSHNSTRSALFSKWVIYSFLMLFLLVLQNTLALHISNICLILPAVIILALNDESDACIILGGVFGLLWDITSGSVFGYNALLMILFAFAAQIIANNLIRVKLLTNLLTVLSFAAVYQLLTYMIFFLFWGKGGAWYTIFTALFRTAVSSAITSTLLFFGIRAIGKRFNSPS